MHRSVNKFRLRCGYRRTVVQIYLDCGAFYSTFWRVERCFSERHSLSNYVVGKKGKEMAKITSKKNPKTENFKKRRFSKVFHFNFYLVNNQSCNIF
jgi:hypothetical protein